MTLTEWLTQTGRKPADFAREIKVAPSSISRWVDGTSMPSNDAMRLIAKFTQNAVTPNDFFGIKGDR
jgi:transcriptional regulator with XRE-family HTH domain